MTMTQEELHAERLVDCLNALIKHDRAAYDLCDAAATRLSAIRPRARVREIGDDHLRRVDKLSRHVRALGGLPTREKADLVHGREGATNISGDRSLLMVVLEDERVVAEAYENVAQREIPLAEVRKLVVRGHRHQRHHHRWLEQSLQGSEEMAS
jgi:hypothetical protein